MTCIKQYSFFLCLPNFHLHLPTTQFLPWLTPFCFYLGFPSFYWAYPVFTYAYSSFFPSWNKSTATEILAQPTAYSQVQCGNPTFYWYLHNYVSLYTSSWCSSPMVQCTLYLNREVLVWIKCFHCNYHPYPWESPMD